MTASSLFLDPRYAALMTTARAMLEQRQAAAPLACDLDTARRLAPILCSTRAQPAGSADRTSSFRGEPEASVEG